MTKRHPKQKADQPIVLLFHSEDDLVVGERLLSARPATTVFRSSAAVRDVAARAQVMRVRHIEQLRAWLKLRREPTPTTFVLALTSEIDLDNRVTAALDSMKVGLPHLLASSRDQIFVLDRDQRIVAFFGHWPKEAPWALKDVLGKHKRDLFGPEGSMVHDAAIQRALHGDDSSYEWTVAHKTGPVHLLTAASPLRSSDGEITGVLLISRNITPLKLEQLALEQSLKERTNQLLDVELGVKHIAARLRPFAPGAGDAATPRLHATAFLSRRERDVLTLLRRGIRLKSIAQKLGLSVETVRRHVKAMFRKTGVHSQDALVQLFEDPNKVT